MKRNIFWKYSTLLIYRAANRRHFDQPTDFMISDRTGLKEKSLKIDKQEQLLESKLNWLMNRSSSTKYVRTILSASNSSSNSNSLNKTHSLPLHLMPPTENKSGCKRKIEPKIKWIKWIEVKLTIIKLLLCINM